MEITLSIPPKKPQTPQDKINTVRALMESRKMVMEKSAPHIMNLDRAIRLALTTFQRNPKLLDCHPSTLLGAVIQVTQLGLELDSATNQAHLVPFWNKRKNRFDATLIIGYKGLETLAVRTKLVKRIVPRVVREGDIFKFSYGLNQTLEHVPMFKSSNLTYVYAVAYLSDGEKEILVLSKDEVEKARIRSRAADEGPWVTDYEEMAMKTVIRRLCKKLPNCNPETNSPIAMKAGIRTNSLMAAISLDESAEQGRPQDLGLIADPETETPTPEEPVTPPRVEIPALPVEAKVEKTLAERWEVCRELANKNAVNLKELLAELKIKEVKNDNIMQIESALFAHN